MEEVIHTAEPTAVVPEIHNPSELVLMLNNWITSKVPHRIIQLRGIYKRTNSLCYNGFYYDTLKDENREETLSIKLSDSHRCSLQHDKIAHISGILSRWVSPNGQIKLTFEVTRVEGIEERATDETELRRSELRQRKSAKGFKNIDTLLEGLLFKDHTPRIALLLAEGSITLSDFEAGVKAAKAAIDFEEHRIPFSRSKELAFKLQQLDSDAYDVIAIVRGGGSGIEALDELDILSTIVELKTPIIGAIGHVEEQLFVKQILDKVAPTPNGLGQYFSDLVERISEEKNHSRAVLTEKIKKQFESQLAASHKQNKELQEKLLNLDQTQKKNTETMAQATKQLEGQLSATQKRNKELQEKLSKLSLTQKQNAEAILETNKQQQQHNAALQEQLKQLGNSLKLSQEQSKRIQEKLDQVNAQKEQLKRELARTSLSSTSNYWKAIAIGAIILCLILGFSLL